MGSVITPSGQRLRFEEDGQGPPLLMLHGWAMASAAMAPLAKRLAAGHRVIRYDLRGHGGSAAAPTATVDDHAADLVALAAAIPIERGLVVAWSLGVQVLLRALPSLGRRVAGAVLVAGTPRFTCADDWPHGLPARQVDVLAARFRRDPARTRGRFLADLLTPGEREAFGSDRLAALDAAMPLPDEGAALAGLDQLATADLRGELAAVDLPVLLLHGEADPICPAGASRAAAAAIPGARLSLLQGAGHAPFLTREEETVAAILAFARERGA
ncbi:MAG TPA: alpha/beta fold hydrolase [Anaeromyxobacteraceae bacterium]|nr:alpha/beta fold hydrolase [Anaeromyxobacteraceae bacterium]